TRRDSAGSGRRAFWRRSKHPAVRSPPRNPCPGTDATAHLRRLCASPRCATIGSRQECSTLRSEEEEEDHRMRAAWYERNGAAGEAVAGGTAEPPEPVAGEVRVKLVTAGVNPSDVKSRAGSTGRPMAAPRIIPHSDGGGVIDKVGAGVPAARVGERVWVWNGQWRRALGTAAEYIVLPAALAGRPPHHVGFAEAAGPGLPALTAHHAGRAAAAET